MSIDKNIVYKLMIDRFIDKLNKCKVVFFVIQPVMI